MKTFLITLVITVIGVIPSSVLSQELNLIPNNSFEAYDGVPIGWFYNGNQFSRLVKYWKSPTMASPDAFGPGVMVPPHWKKKGFGVINATHGSSFIGLTLYGCSNGKPHCREYVQIQLIDSLVPGQKYRLEMDVAHLENALHVNNLSIYFSREAFCEKTDGLIEKRPQLTWNEILIPKKDYWLKLSKDFIADSTYNYITIGNYYSDDQSEIDRENALYEYAYYYIDNVSLKKVPPIIPQELPPDDITRETLEVGKTIQLKNIYFDLDKSDLLPRSYLELNKLVNIMFENPMMRIEVHGHTDIQGESDYNVELSKNRALAVTNYLVQSGVHHSRIDYRGFGSDIPIAENTSEEGRQMNRRVEILITEL